MDKYELKNTIYNWVAKNFGESEANEPSWDIDALAEHIAEMQAAKTKYNGWTNYATWRVNLELIDGEAQAIREDGQTFASVQDLADHLEQHVDDYTDLALDGVQDTSTIVAGWANAFTNQVNYREIAENMISDNSELLVVK